MKRYLNSAFHPLAVVLTIALFTLSCKKSNERTSTQWGELATAKINEITVLTASIPCAQEANVTIQKLDFGCSATYYPVKTSDQSTFDQLKKEYFHLLNEQSKALYREGVIVDPCFLSLWISEQPIRLACKAGTVQVITSANLSIEEAKPLAAKTYEEIMALVNAQTCTGASAWMYTGLIKSRMMDLEFIPYLTTQDHTELRKKIELYNRLKARIIQEEGPADVAPPKTKVGSIECINGKPVIKLVPAGN
jgi:hypothetical protein